MRLRCFSARFFLLLLAAGSLAAQERPQADEIPIERCDRLPVVKVFAGGAEMRFLLDTGATTLLNLKSFTGSKTKNVQISSWSGTASTSAREVKLAELVLGRYRLRDLKLPAIDLSPIGAACGGRIDGILGVDLLEKMGATIDLERRVARLGAPSGGSVAAQEEALAREHFLEQHECLDAFNHGDIAALERCLDPEVVLFTPWGESRGRKAMLEYVQSQYFSRSPRPQMEMQVKSVRILGSAAWYDYDYTIATPVGQVKGRGTGVCRRSGDRWLLLNMHNSRVEPQPH